MNMASTPPIPLMVKPPLHPVFLEGPALLVPQQLCCACGATGDLIPLAWVFSPRGASPIDPEKQPRRHTVWYGGWSHGPTDILAFRLPFCLHCLRREETAGGDVSRGGLLSRIWPGFARDHRVAPVTIHALRWALGGERLEYLVLQCNLPAYAQALRQENAALIEAEQLVVLTA